LDGRNRSPRKDAASGKANRSGGGSTTPGRSSSGGSSTAITNGLRATFNRQSSSERRLVSAAEAGRHASCYNFHKLCTSWPSIRSRTGKRRFSSRQLNVHFTKFCGGLLRTTLFSPRCA